MELTGHVLKRPATCLRQQCRSKPQKGREKEANKKQHYDITILQTIEENLKAAELA